MSDDSQVLSRRAALASAAVSGLVLSLPSADASEQTAGEKSDIDLVRSFMRAWKGPPNSPKLGEFIAEQCFIIILPGPPAPATTRAAAVEMFKSQLENAPEGFDLNVLSATARGGAVFITRRDYGLKDGKRTDPLGVKDGKRADPGASAVALLIVKDGKISNWYDYTFT